MTIKVKSLNVYDAIREKLDEHNTMNVNNPVTNGTAKTKVSTGLQFKLISFFIIRYIENMALLSASGFIGYSDSFAAPAGFNDPIFAGPVDLNLSAGIIQQVFDTLSSALKCIKYMEANNLYSPGPNEDVTVLNIRSKLLILENI